jgi:hypothetical protein
VAFDTHAVYTAFVIRAAFAATAVLIDFAFPLIFSLYTAPMSSNVIALAITAGLERPFAAYPAAAIHAF